MWQDALEEIDAPKDETKGRVGQGSSLCQSDWKPKAMLVRFVKNYVARHQHPVNQLLHAVGVPLTFVASIVFLVQNQPWWALGCFVGGYVLQFIGHAIEGNDAGEVVLIKRWRGLPYKEFAPGREPRQPL